MKFINEKDKKILFVLGLIIIFGWLTILTLELHRVDSNFQIYVESLTRENATKNSKASE